MNSLSSELYKSIKQTNSYAVGAVGTALSAFAFYWEPNATVSIKWLSIPVLAILIVVITLLDVAIRLHGLSQKQLPTVVSAQKLTLREREGILLLLEPSILFSTSVIVSVYHVNSEGWEILIGVGRVHHVQEDGKVQIFVHMKSQNSEEKWSDVERRDSGTLNGLRVKPSAPYELIVEGVTQ